MWKNELLKTDDMKERERRRTAWRIRAIQCIALAFLLGMAFGIIRARAETGNPYTEIIENLDSEEEYLLKTIVYAEAGNQSTDGQRAVIEVIFNRMLSDEYPDHIGEVLSQKGQFATWRYRHRISPTADQDAALQLVYEESPILPSTEYVFFDTSGRNGTEHIKIGAHYFGRLR